MSPGKAPAPGLLLGLVVIVCVIVQGTVTGESTVGWYIGFLDVTNEMGFSMKEKIKQKLFNSTGGGGPFL